MAGLGGELHKAAIYGGLKSRRGRTGKIEALHDIVKFFVTMFEAVLSDL
jgi:hypothetical protein